MDLLEGETLIWGGRPSWRSMMAYYLGYGLLTLVPVVAVALLNGLADQDLPLGWALLVTIVLLVAVLVIGWVRRVDTYYVVSDQRIMIRHGILSRKEQTARLERVQNVNTSQSLVQRIFRVGDIDFDTAGGEVTESSFRFVGIDDPHGLRQKIDKAYRLAESRRDGV